MALNSIFCVGFFKLAGHFGKCLSIGLVIVVDTWLYRVYLSNLSGTVNGSVLENKNWKPNRADDLKLRIFFVSTIRGGCKVFQFMYHIRCIRAQNTFDSACFLFGQWKQADAFAFAAFCSVHLCFFSYLAAKQAWQLTHTGGPETCFSLAHTQEEGADSQHIHTSVMGITKSKI